MNLMPVITALPGIDTGTGSPAGSTLNESSSPGELFSSVLEKNIAADSPQPDTEAPVMEKIFEDILDKAAALSQAGISALAILLTAMQQHTGETVSGQAAGTDKSSTGMPVSDMEQALSDILNSLSDKENNGSVKELIGNLQKIFEGSLRQQDDSDMLQQKNSETPDVTRAAISALSLTPGAEAAEDSCAFELPDTSPSSELKNVTGPDMRQGVQTAVTPVRDEGTVSKSYGNTATLSEQPGEQDLTAGTDTAALNSISDHDNSLLSNAAPDSASDHDNSLLSNAANRTESTDSSVDVRDQKPRPAPDSPGIRIKNSENPAENLTGGTRTAENAPVESVNRQPATSELSADGPQPREQGDALSSTKISGGPDMNKDRWSPDATRDNTALIIDYRTGGDNAAGNESNAFDMQHHQDSRASQQVQSAASTESVRVKPDSFSLENLKAAVQNDPSLRDGILDQIRGGIERTVSLNRTRAVIHLNPPELGSLSIRINVSHNNQIHASFIAENIHTHQMIESGMDSLKSTLAQNGFDLEQVNVYFSGGGMHDTGTSHRDQAGSWQHQLHTGHGENDADSSQEATLTADRDSRPNSGVHVIM